MQSMNAHTSTPPPSSPALRGWVKAALWALVLIVLGGVFAMYLQPDFMVDMANQVWACF